MNNKIVFLILNYETYWETIACVKSIYQTVGRDKIINKIHEIVIVDNGSTNDSLSVLRKEYDNSIGVYVLSMRTNLGFAKGNNYGFKYAKENLNPGFIVMINSDIIMTDVNFEEKLVQSYNQYEFAVAGPNVVLPNGCQLNPVVSDLLEIEDVDRAILNIKMQIFLCEKHIEIFYLVWKRIKNAFKRRKQRGIVDVLELEKGQQLHGCFLIFSNKYIRKFDGIYDKTFLYGEETLLRLRCIKAQLKMCYLHDVTAIHNESQTEKYISRNIYERHKRRYQNTLDSLFCIGEYIQSEQV